MQLLSRRPADTVNACTLHLTLIDTLTAHPRDARPAAFALCRDAIVPLAVAAVPTVAAPSAVSRGAGDRLLTHLADLLAALSGLGPVAADAARAAAARAAMLDVLCQPDVEVAAAALRALAVSWSPTLTLRASSLDRLAADGTFRDELAVLTAELGAAADAAVAVADAAADAAAAAAAVPAVDDAAAVTSAGPDATAAATATTAAVPAHASALAPSAVTDVALEDALVRLCYGNIRGHKDGLRARRAAALAVVGAGLRGGRAIDRLVRLLTSPLAAPIESLLAVAAGGGEQGTPAVPAAPLLRFGPLSSSVLSGGDRDCAALDHPQRLRGAPHRRRGAGAG